MAVVAVAAIVLAVMALQHVASRPAATDPEPVPSFTFGSPATPEPTATPSATPAPVTGPTYPRTEERFLSVGSGGMWRGVAGECGVTDPLIERSTDGGQTWSDVTPLYRGIGQLISLDAFAGTEAEAIARMGDECETEALRTFTQGRFWEPYPEVLAASRYLDAADSTVLVTPRGPLESPCADPRSVRTSGGTVALVCDGTAHVLGSDGEWTALPTPDAAAVAIAGDAVIVAARADGCEGLAITRLSGGGFADAAAVGCAPGDPAAPVALATSGDATLVWSGDSLTRLP
ncbi:MULTISPECIES: hypothetical protein [Microbacterium]|uniref:Exo-alpha-sialidase n=1 Tax=Microbacterium wangchenii TaxID=2541726 RepID=A0ABX5SPN5_9MICO|nr:MULTISPECIES: hypothetical protein [Microbacterium]MCK6068095.1 hypothetical protein [Microbacterium sp. EYE_512]QBR87782.1 hypothetical protein E4K62_03135 [Microbacterium wangchenii]